jgi:hypothetical protein
MFTIYGFTQEHMIYLLTVHIPPYRDLHEVKQ